MGRKQSKVILGKITFKKLPREEERMEKIVRLIVYGREDESKVRLVR
jgi:hypothetical protein